MVNNYKRGIYLAFITAIVSGIAVFVSSFATKIVKEPFVLTSLRNIIVAIWFSTVLIGISRWVSLKQLSIKQWGQLILIGLIGGSIPFLLFFKGLSLSTATGGAFIQKTLFIWVGILAVIFLKEKLGRWQILALLILLVGNYFLSVPKSWHFGTGELLIFIATIFWAVETIIAKAVLTKIPPIVVGWGRMFFGSIFMLIFLFFTHRLSIIGGLNLHQWSWIVFPSILLFAYVILWFNALKQLAANVVTSILTLGSLITTLLSSIFVTNKYKLSDILAMSLITLAIIIYIKFLPRTKNVQNRKFAVR